MESKPNSKKRRLGAALGLLGLLIAMLIWFGRDSKSFPRQHPKIGQETGVIIEGSVSCNDRPLTTGYVIAWQGPPVAFAQVQSDGSYRITDGPLGKCIITYSTNPPPTVPLDQVVPGVPKPGIDSQGGSDKMGSGLPPFLGEGGPKGKDVPGKDRPSLKDLKSLSKEKAGFPPKIMPFPPGGGPPGGGGPPKDVPFPPGGGDGPPKDMSFPPKDGAMPPFGKMGPPPFGAIDSETRQLAERASRKYGDPVKKLIELTTRKGVNPLNILLATP